MTFFSWFFNAFNLSPRPPLLAGEGEQSSNTPLSCKERGWGRGYIFYLLLFTLTTHLCFGQLEQVVKKQIDVSTSDSEDFEVDLLQSDGLLLTKKIESFYGKERWVFYRYDTSLNQLWEAEFKPEYGLKPLQSYHNKIFAYWLFQESDNEKFQILRLDLQNGETDVYKGNFMERSDITHFKVLGSMALLGGYWRDRPTVLVFSLFDKTTKVLPHLFHANTQLKNIEIDENHNEINVILYAFKKSTCEFSIKTYAYDGRMLRNTAVLSKTENALISGKILTLDPTYSLLVGNYAQGCTDYSQGLYVTRLNNGEPENLQWIDFSKLENFFNYLNPRRKQRMVDKINKQKEEGKEPKFRYKLLVHDLIKANGELVLVAEVYYPISRNGSNIYMNNRFRSNEKERTHDAYRFTHAIVCGFEPESGKLLWDNCFALKDLENVELLEMVQVNQLDNQLVMAYPYKDKIHAEVIQKNKVVREKEEFDMKKTTDETQEKIADNEDESLAAWYDTHFLAYGFQKIISKGNAPNKEVFFMSKLKYEPK